ncbi:MAG: hypothetical protein ACRETI_04755 [Steroidobacteraceae bacterium]
MSGDIERLIAALQRMPVPEPRPGFVQEALAHATESGRRSNAWIGAAGAGVAAALVGVAVLVTRPDEDSIRLYVDQPQEVRVVIDSEHALQGATITVHLTGDMSLYGFADARDLLWRTDLAAGMNLLALPVVAHGPGDGHLIAIVEHGGRARRIGVELRAEIAHAGKVGA